MALYSWLDSRSNETFPNSFGQELDVSANESHTNKKVGRLLSNSVIAIDEIDQ